MAPTARWVIGAYLARLMSDGGCGHCGSAWGGIEPEDAVCPYGGEDRCQVGRQLVQEEDRDPASGIVEKGDRRDDQCPSWRGGAKKGGGGPGDREVEEAGRRVLEGEGAGDPGIAKIERRVNGDGDVVETPFHEGRGQRAVPVRVEMPGELGDRHAMI